MKIDAPCPCDSGFPLAACCAPYIRGIAFTPTALTTMRSRYTAYVLGNVDYLRETWHPRTRPTQLAADPNKRWLGLDIKNTNAGEPGDMNGTIEFVARFKVAGRAHRLHEVSRFSYEGERWFYVDGDLS